MLRLLDSGVAWLADILSLRAQHRFISADGGAVLAHFDATVEHLEQDFAAACRRASVEPSLPKQADVAAAPMQAITATGARASSPRATRKTSVHSTTRSAAS